jgi:hypothetical protein
MAGGDADDGAGAKADVDADQGVVDARAGAAAGEDREPAALSAASAALVAALLAAARVTRAAAAADQGDGDNQRGDRGQGEDDHGGDHRGEYDRGGGHSVQRLLAAGRERAQQERERRRKRRRAWAYGVNAADGSDLGYWQGGYDGYGSADGGYFERVDGYAGYYGGYGGGFLEGRYASGNDGAGPRPKRARELWWSDRPRTSKGADATAASAAGAEAGADSEGGDVARADGADTVAAVAARGQRAVQETLRQVLASAKKSSRTRRGKSSRHRFREHSDEDSEEEEEEEEKRYRRGRDIDSENGHGDDDDDDGRDGGEWRRFRDRRSRSLDRRLWRQQQQQQQKHRPPPVPSLRRVPPRPPTPQPAAAATAVAAAAAAAVADEPAWQPPALSELVARGESAVRALLQRRREADQARVDARAGRIGSGGSRSGVGGVGYSTYSMMGDESRAFALEETLRGLGSSTAVSAGSGSGGGGGSGRVDWMRLGIEPPTPRQPQSRLHSVAGDVAHARSPTSAFKSAGEAAKGFGAARSLHSDFARAAVAAGTVASGQSVTAHQKARSHQTERSAAQTYSRSSVSGSYDYVRSHAQSYGYGGDSSFLAVEYGRGGTPLSVAASAEPADEALAEIEFADASFQDDPDSGSNPFMEAAFTDSELPPLFGTADSDSGSSRGRRSRSRSDDDDDAAAAAAAAAAVAAATMAAAKAKARLQQPPPALPLVPPPQMNPRTRKPPPRVRASPKPLAKPLGQNSGKWRSALLPGSSSDGMPPPSPKRTRAPPPRAPAHASSTLTPLIGAGARRTPPASPLRLDGGLSHTDLNVQAAAAAAAVEAAKAAPPEARPQLSRRERLLAFAFAGARAGAAAVQRQQLQQQQQQQQQQQYGVTWPAQPQVKPHAQAQAKAQGRTDGLGRKTSRGVAIEEADSSAATVSE